MENYLPISITFEELQAKGFAKLDLSSNAIYPYIIHLFAWGEVFVCGKDNLDEAASTIWNEFCDFINGRSETTIQNNY